MPSSAAITTSPRSISVIEPTSEHNWRPASFDAAAVVSSADFFGIDICSAEEILFCQ